jgi:Holliday junction resolvase RusA-like endonuclease
MIAKFTVHGEPQGKGRPRFSTVAGHVKTRTPDQTVVYENLIQMEYRSQCGSLRFPEDAMLDVRVMAYYSIPKSASKKKRAAMLAHEIRPTKKPDFDNIGKVVCDSLNGVAYRDDAQIVDAMVRKFFSDSPRVVITIRECGGADA